MNDKLPPLPAPEAWRTRVGPWGDHSTDYAYTVNQMREYAAQAVAAALSDRHALQGRGAHPAPCARQCEAQAFRSEIAAEQRRCEMYVDLVRRTAEALGLTREDGWHDLPERVRALQTELAAAIKDRQMTEDATADEVHVLRAALEAQQEQCRINADGTTAYNWPVIEAAAAKWRPFETDWTACMAKLLLPLKPKGEEE